MKNIISVILSVMLVGTVSLLFVAKSANESLDKDLTKSKSNVDSLTRATGLLDQKVNKFRNSLDSAWAKASELTTSVQQMKASLARQTAENHKSKKLLEESEKKVREMGVAQKDWEGKMSSLKVTMSQLTEENKSLRSKNMVLDETIKKLNDEVASLILSTKDNIQIESTTKSGQLNVKGRRIKKINISFSTESELKKPEFRIYDPSGAQLPDQFGTFSLQSHQDNSPNGKLKLELTYLLSKKIGSGLYRVEMMNENRHMGNVLVRFR